MRAMLRHPLLHFLVLGALAYTLTGMRDTSVEVIVLGPADVAALRATWQRETGRVPGGADLQASLRRHADEEMLVREALRRGLDRRDAVVRERLLRNVAFVFPEQDLASSRALSLARELGLAERDVVVRRRLVQLMEAALASDAHAIPGGQPTPVTGTPVERRAVHHLWFEGDEARARSTAALAALQSGDAGAAQASDPFLLGARFAPLEEAQLGQRMGARFARAAMQATPGDWIGPVESVYGWHLLRVERIEVAPARQVHPYRALAAREALALREGLARLRTRYPLHVALAAP